MPTKRVEGGGLFFFEKQEGGVVLSAAPLAVAQPCFTRNNYAYLTRTAHTYHATSNATGKQHGPTNQP
jgi:hypothetical protein